MRSVVAVLVLVLASCNADDPFNESFPVRYDDAKALLKEMQAAPVQVERPVIVAGGIHDPGLLVGHLAKQLKKATNEDVVMTTVTFTGLSSFDRCREQLPAYMVPRSVRIVEELPLNANGKIDRKQLARQLDEP